MKDLISRNSYKQTFFLLVRLYPEEERPCRSQLIGYRLKYIPKCTINIESVASYMRFDFIGLSSGMESIFITIVINVGAGGTIPAVAPNYPCFFSVQQQELYHLRLYHEETHL